MQTLSVTSTLLPTLGLAGLVFGLGAIFSSPERWQNLETQAPEFTTLTLVVGVLCLAAAALLLALPGAEAQPLHRVLAYAWNPTVIVSFAMCGHHDALAIVTLLATILFIIHRKPALSLTFLTLSVLSKFFSLLLLAVFLKRSRAAYAALFAVVVTVGYLPYLGAGWKLFAGLSDHATGQPYRESPFILALEYGLVFAWMAFQGWEEIRNSRMESRSS